LIHLDETLSRSLIIGINNKKEKLGWRMLPIFQQSVLEIIDLYSIQFKIWRRAEIYYWKGYHQNEADFVIKNAIFISPSLAPTTCF
jgi:hypothetical protein